MSTHMDEDALSLRFPDYHFMVRGWIRIQHQSGMNLIKFVNEKFPPSKPSIQISEVRLIGSDTAVVSRSVL